MCGIFGYYSSKEILDKNILNNAINLINHRGPDQSELKILNSKEAIGYKRLSIVDSTNITMPFRIGNTYTVFNGEIYNHISLKNKY